MNERKWIISITVLSAFLFISCVVFFVFGEYRLSAGLAIVAFLLFLWAAMNAARNATETVTLMKKGKEEYEKLQKEAELLRLTVSSEAHGDEFLMGYARALDFFVDNYLSRNNAGVSELHFLKVSRKVVHAEDVSGGIFQDNNEFEAYRTAMMFMLLGEDGITDEEFAKLKGYCTRAGSVETLERLAYSKTIYDSMVKDKIMEIRNAQHEK